MAIHRLRASFIHICLLLTTLIHTAAAIPFCTALYGTPDHESCDQLLYGDLSRGYRGLGNRDYRTHLFALPLTWRPLHITDEQWNNKVNLPIIRSNLLCKLALLPILSTTGTISSDTSYYSDLALTGDLIQSSCVSPYNMHPSGGHAVAGDSNRLLLILYARNSDFDFRVRRRLAQREPILGIEEANGAIEPGTGSNADDAASSTGTTELGFGSNANSATSSPTCGQYCWGPGAPCDAASGCRCIADAWQGVGSAFFTGICKVPYRLIGSLFSGAGGRELLGSAAGGGLNLTNVTVSVGSNSIVEGGLAADTACPCNCTYVSRACCTSATGIVHEAADLKLGMLKAPNSSLVCDGTTGHFRPQLP